MNRSYISSNSFKKNKASGYRRLSKNNKGRKIMRMRRRKGRAVI